MSGNPSTDNYLDFNSYLKFLTQHALISLEDYEETYRICRGNFTQDNTTVCYQHVQRCFATMGTRVNPYNIYALCDGQGAPYPGYCLTAATSQNIFAPQGQTFIPCVNVDGCTTYFNRKDVQTALYVANTNIPGGSWSICSQVLNYPFNPSFDPKYSMIRIYDYLVHHIRVLIYSGDADSCVNYVGTQEAAFRIRAPGKKDTWRAWFVDQQVGGYVKQLGNNLHFLTVKGAGHMVPGKTLGKPKEALALFERFLNGEEF